MSTEKTYERERGEAAKYEGDHFTSKNMERAFKDGTDWCKSRFEKIIETMEQTAREVENARRKISEEKTEKILSLEKIVAEKDAEIQEWERRFNDVNWGPTQSKLTSAHDIIEKCKRLLQFYESNGHFNQSTKVRDFIVDITEWERVNK